MNFDALGDGSFFKKTNDISGVNEPEGITIDIYQSITGKGWMVSVQSSPLSSKSIEEEYGPYNSRKRAETKASKLRKKY